jgi:hypothetical protein
VNLNPEVPWLIFGFLESSSKLPYLHSHGPFFGEGLNERRPLDMPLYL